MFVGSGKWLEVFALNFPVHSSHRQRARSFILVDNNRCQSAHCRYVVMQEKSLCVVASSPLSCRRQAFPLGSPRTPLRRAAGACGQRPHQSGCCSILSFCECSKHRFSRVRSHWSIVCPNSSSLRRARPRRTASLCNLVVKLLSLSNAVGGLPRQSYPQDGPHRPLDFLRRTPLRHRRESHQKSSQGHARRGLSLSDAIRRTRAQAHRRPALGIPFSRTASPHCAWQCPHPPQMAPARL